jgi:acylphosphatase
VNRVLPAVFVLALSAPAFGQTVNDEGAKQLSENLSHYIGKQAIDSGFLKVSVEGDAYKLAVDFKPVVDPLATQHSFKFDFSPYAFLVKPRSNGTWDVSADVSPSGSFEFKGPEGPQSMQFSLKDGKFTGVYDPELAAFTSATQSIAGMTMNSQDAMQRAKVSTGAGTATMRATKAAKGGVDFTAMQTIADFAEALDFDDPKSGLKFPLTIKSPELSVNATGKGVRTKPFLDLLAFAVANESEAKLKANQAQLKSLLLAALPLWERIDGSYGLKDLTVESSVGHFGAAELGTSFGTDGIAQNGAINYTIKAAGLTIPHNLVPAWGTALLPTDINLNFGGANINLDSMAKKAIEAFDLNQDPPLPANFGEMLTADFMANTPKVVIGHSTVKNGEMEIAIEGEVTFPGMKPEANMTIYVAGYDKIVESLQAAAKSEPEAAQYVPVALAIKGFGKTLPNGRIEWVVNGKPDGSVTVNGVMVKPADPVVNGEADDSKEETTP